MSHYHDNILAKKLCFCQTQDKLKAKKVDEGEALACLIEHKNDDDMDLKCQASIEHFQLVSGVPSHPSTRILFHYTV